MDDLKRAVELLRAGKLVAFPTETVYGLGADASHAAAVKRIFAAKGRPATNPLIVHVADAAAGRRWAGAWPKAAEVLTRAFWPGPLTLVLPRAASIADEVSAGRGTVGLRAPDHPLALELLRRFGGPVAAPSANRSSRISPTTAEHVRADLEGEVDLILDGGPCRVGIESTVLDLSCSPPAILRPGAVSRAQIESLIGEVTEAGGTDAGSARSPGRQQIHYAPRAKAFYFEADEVAAVLAWRTGHETEKMRLLVLNEELSMLPGSVRMPRSPAPYAVQLYAALHEADASGASVILLELPSARPEWIAVRDRLTRAARPLGRPSPQPSPGVPGEGE